MQHRASGRGRVKGSPGRLPFTHPRRDVSLLHLAEPLDLFELLLGELARDVANDRQLGDTTTLADPTVVDEIAKRASDEKAQEDEA